MEWGSNTSASDDVAANIAKLQKTELDRFLRDHLRKRDLHIVVANLNEAALSRDRSKSKMARNALVKLGFTD